MVSLTSDRALTPQRVDEPALTVLFVDHSRVSQAVWNRVILRLGHRALVAASAEQALETLAATPVDVICTALSLPAMDGIELCRQLRIQPTYAALPIVLLTSRQDHETRERARIAGVTDIQAKTDVERLLRRLRSYADQTETGLRGRVLYVEDSDVVTLVMTRILRKLNLQVDHFQRADAAFAAFENRDYDLVVTDIQTAGELGGAALIERIRGYAGRRGRVPIIATSGNEDRRRKSELFRLGIDDFLAKPAIEEEVVARVGNLLRSKYLDEQVRTQQARLRELALIDPLTGLLNAASLHELGPKYLSEAARHNQHLSLLLVDIDDLATLTRQYGRATADTAIGAVARLLGARCRGEDLVARYADDQFAILLPHCGAGHAPIRAEQLRRQIAALKPDGIPLTASVGISARPEQGDAAFGDLLAAAQRAVAMAREDGRNPVAARSL